MNRRDIDLLVLDAHGVVLNRYWPAFLREVARRTHQSAGEVVRRWQDTLRADAWTGRIDDEAIWKGLAPSNDSTLSWRDILEGGYTLGPAAPHLRRWERCVPMWILSNHRTNWLLPRLQRFDVLDRFERVLVSDSVGAAKPDFEAFDDVLTHARDPQRVLFVDDQTQNVDAARHLGLVAIQAKATTRWTEDVDRILNRSRPRASATSYIQSTDLAAASTADRERVSRKSPNVRTKGGCHEAN